MNLITKVKIPEFNFRISHHSKTLFTGSCFAENIGNKFLKLKFPTQVNPLGINYNPISLGNSLHRAIDRKSVSVDELFSSNGLWNSFDFHSKFSDTDKEFCLSKINQSIKETSGFLKNTDVMFVSFGTAYAYTLKDTNTIVSNCHKQSDNKFSRNLLEAQEIISYWTNLIEKLRVFNPNIKIIFTISPIRHKREGFIANQLSKSTLFIAVNELMKQFEDIYYFPSYEILMDELRDYRFYKEDMIHPSDVAIDYIMERFTKMFFKEDTIQLIITIEKIIVASKHRPFNSDTDEYILFCKNMLDKIHQVVELQPNIDFSIEEKFFNENI